VSGLAWVETLICWEFLDEPEMLLEKEVLRDNNPSGRVNTNPYTNDIESYRLSPNPGGSLDDRDLKLTTELVRDASSQRLAIDVFRYDDQRDSRLGGGLERRQYILLQGYLPPAQEDSNYFWLLTSVMKYGLTNPRSNRIPSVISISSSML
jgi:hypothetical protein